MLDADGTITPGVDTHNLHLYDEEPTSPKEGDVYKDSTGEYLVYQNNEWYSLGANLDDAQMAAIDALVDVRATVVTYQGGTITTRNIVGSINADDIPNIDQMVGIKLGTTVTSIVGGAF